MPPRWYTYSAAFVDEFAMRAIGLLLPLLTGCYILRQASGQLDVLLNSRPVEEVEPALPRDEASKLRLISEIKEFGERSIGITRTRNYTSYFDTKGKPITYVVTACRKDRFEPYTWWFPIIGTLPYKGFFTRDEALAQARRLEAEGGWDVRVGGSAAYSTLGWFSDPVFSSMLGDSEEDLANLILHELTHSTVYVSGRADFNESLASFVGTQGSLDFIRWRYGERSEMYERAVAKAADEEVFDDFMRRLFDELRQLYAERRPDALSRRENVFRRAKEEYKTLPLRTGAFDGFLAVRLNNAVILQQRRYGRLDLYRRVFEGVGSDWPRFFEAIRHAAAQPDPMSVLEMRFPST